MRKAWTGELTLLGVGAVLSGALTVRTAPPGLIVESCLVTAVYGALLCCLMRTRSLMSLRARLVLSYFFTVWFYSGVQRMTPALGFPIQDSVLRGFDECLFSEMPALSFQSWSSDHWTELFSFSYLTFHVYMNGVLGVAIWSGRSVERLGNLLFLAFGLGFVGYLLVPAVGPGAAFPELFSPLPEGYGLAKLNRFVVAQGSSTYDVFPSLHGLITATLLFFDFREHRTRFWVMLGPCLALLVSTLYLRYHYATDLLAAAICFVFVAAWDRKQQYALIGDEPVPTSPGTSNPE